MQIKPEQLEQRLKQNLPAFIWVSGDEPLLVQETCDYVVNLPMQGHVESLNASVAAALILYEVRRTRGFD